MYCPKCGTKCADDIAYCPNCGRRLPSSAPQPAPVQPALQPDPVQPDPVQPDPVQPAPVKKSWPTGARVWFGIEIIMSILAPVLSYLELSSYSYETDTQVSVALQALGWVIITAFITVALLVWIIVSKKKIALYTMIAIQVISIGWLFVQGDAATALGSCVNIVLNWHFAHNVVS